MRNSTHRARLAVCALLLMLTAGLAPVATAHDGHNPPPPGQGPWQGRTPIGNFSTIPELTLEKGYFFMFTDQVGSEIAHRRYTVLDVKDMEVMGEPRKVVLYGWDHVNAARGSRDAYIEYRDAKTWDLVRIHKFGHSTDMGQRLGRDVVKVFEPPYREAVFPMYPGASWTNQVNVTETRSIYYTDPVEGPRTTTSVQRSYVENYGRVRNETVNIDVAGRNVTTFQTFTIDRFSNRSDRHNWIPDVPVPVRIVRYDLNLTDPANSEVLQTIRLVDFHTDPLPEVTPAADPLVTRVNVPVTLKGVGSDPHRRITSFFWTFGDPTKGAGNLHTQTVTPDTPLAPGEVVPQVMQAWQRPGNYTLRLGVTLTGGLSLNYTLNVTVENEPPEARVHAPATAASGEQVYLDGTDSYDPDGPIAAWSWSFSDGVTLDGPVVSRTFTAPVTHGTLTVTDSVGATGTAAFTVTLGNASGTAPTPHDGKGPTLAIGLAPAGKGFLWANVTALDPDGLAVLTLSVNGAVMNTSKTAESAFQIPLPLLREGDNRIEVKAWDKRGLSSTAGTVYTHVLAPPPGSGPSWLDRVGNGTSRDGQGAPDAETEGTPWFSIPGPGALLAAAAVAGAAVAASRGRRRT